MSTVQSELPDRETGFLYVVRGLKHVSDEYGPAYNHVWGTHYTLDVAIDQAKQFCETSYADEIIIEEYELVTKTTAGAGVPIQNRRKPHAVQTENSVQGMPIPPRQSLSGKETG